MRRLIFSFHIPLSRTIAAIKNEEVIAVSAIRHLPFLCLFVLLESPQLRHGDLFVSTFFKAAYVAACKCHFIGIYYSYDNIGGDFHGNIL